MTPTSNAADRTLDRSEASEYLRERYGLKVPRRTLDRYASTRRKIERGCETVKGELGPPYTRFGVRSVYRVCDLDTWVSAKLNPTSEAKPKKKRRLKPRGGGHPSEARA